MLIGCIMHRIRNGRLLELSTTIQMATMNGASIDDIHNKYIEFAIGLEEEIEAAIDDYNSKPIEEF